MIAALEREVAPLLQGWRRDSLSWTGGHGVSGRPLYTREWREAGEVRLRSALVIAGTGADNAEDSCQALIDRFSPSMVISVGFAGALLPELGVGDIVIPAQIARDGYAVALNFPTEFGQGVVVSVNRVVAGEEKLHLARQYAASAVEMEAAVVAAVAGARGVKFAAVKAISDLLNDEAIGATAPFIGAQGFELKRFLFHVAVRPKLWPVLATLGRNSKRASLALCRTIEDLLKSPTEFAARCTPQVVRPDGDN